MGDPGAGRVAFVSEHLEGAGGLELFELAIAEGLAARGWQVTVSFAASGNLTDRWAAVADMAPVDGQRSREQVVAGADVAYVHSPHLFRSTLDAAGAAGIPAVGHLHLPPFHLRGGWKGMVRGRHRWPMDEAVYSKHTRFDAFAAVSHFTRKQWVASGLPAHRVRVIHNGIDAATYHLPAAGERAAIRDELGLAPADVVIGYIGRIDLMKGVEAILDAFIEMESEVAGARLLIAGAPTRDAGDDGERLVQRLRSKSPASVLWLGKRDDVARLYHALDVFVMPSRWDEPFGLVLTEAMASGVPVIAARRGGIPEILAGPLDRCLVTPDPGPLADALRTVLRSDRDELSRLGIERVEQAFTVARTAQAVDTMLSDVITAHRSAR